MTTAHLILRYAHISMGMASLLSGAAAMTLAKGSRAHKLAGTAFFVSMIVMAASGTFIAAAISPNRGNIMGGMLAFYLTLTAWLTAWRKPGETGRLEVAAALLGVTTFLIGFASGQAAASSPNGRLDAYAPAFFYIMGGFALLGAVFDVRMLRRGGVTGTARLTRHLGRMCYAMFMATGSFFLGQAKLFPADVRASGVLKIPVLLVIGALIYWMIRVRVWPSIRKRRRGRMPASA